MSFLVIVYFVYVDNVSILEFFIDGMWVIIFLMI